MADKGALRVYTELPSWAKGVVVVGGLVVGYLAVTRIISEIKGAVNKKKSEKEITTAQDELQQEINSGNKPTISRSNAEAISNAIVIASNDCGTDDDLIINAFDSIKNQADMLLLVDVFGLRAKVRCPFSSDTRVDFWSKFTPPMSISAMISSELSSSQIKSLNAKLGAKGISYRF